MKRLLQISLFFALPISMLLLFLLTMSSIRTAWYQPTLPSNKKVLIIGNSHPECAIIESVQDDYVNLGKSGECFYYSIKKADWILSCNPQVTQVWIELAPNQFMPHMEKWIVDSEYEQRALLSFPFLMDAQWEWNAWKKKPLVSLQTKMVQARRYWGAVLAPDWEEDRAGLKWGMYREMKGRSAKFENPDEEGKRTIQPFQDNWMSLVSFCNDLKKRGIEVHAFQCPEYAQQNNFQPIIAYCQKHGLTITQYHEVPFEVKDSSLFYDASHLNKKGAEVFSKNFKQVLSNQLNDHHPF